MIALASVYDSSIGVGSALWLDDALAGSEIKT